MYLKPAGTHGDTKVKYNMNITAQNYVTKLHV